MSFSLKQVYIRLKYDFDNMNTIKVTTCLPKISYRLLLRFQTFVSLKKDILSKLSQSVELFLRNTQLLTAEHKRMHLRILSFLLNMMTATENDKIIWCKTLICFREILINFKALICLREILIHFKVCPK